MSAVNEKIDIVADQVTVHVVVSSGYHAAAIDALTANGVDMDRVEFLIGDDVIFVDREPPFECLHEFDDESRSHIVRAIAYHREGLTVQDAVVTRKITFGSFEEVNRVILWVSVTDRDDEFVTDLDVERFDVRENGKSQQVLELVKEDRPITMAILLDSSGSMQEELRDVQIAAGSFVETLRDEDRAMVIDFDDRVFGGVGQRVVHAEVVSRNALVRQSFSQFLHSHTREITFHEMLGQLDQRCHVIGRVGIHFLKIGD